MFFNVRLYFFHGFEMMYRLWLCSFVKTVLYSAGWWVRTVHRVSYSFLFLIVLRVCWPRKPRLLTRLILCFLLVKCRAIFKFFIWVIVSRLVAIWIVSMTSALSFSFITFASWFLWWFLLLIIFTDVVIDLFTLGRLLVNNECTKSQGCYSCRN